MEHLIEEIIAELARARAKFPGDNATLAALMEEVGELAKAMMEESRHAVRKEAVQVAVMAMRVVLDGDATMSGWRAVKGLDPLVPGGAKTLQELGIAMREAQGLYFTLRSHDNLVAAKQAERAFDKALGIK